MEKYQAIDEYIATEMGDKIVRKAQSPLLGIVTLAIGIGLLVFFRTQKMSDSLMALCLTAGLIALGVGLVLTALCLTKAVWHYVYKPTRCRMKKRRCYLSVSDYQHCLDAISENNLSAIGIVTPVTSSNSALDILYSRDHSIALLQAIRDNSGHFEPESTVIQFTGTEVTHIQSLL